MQIQPTIMADFYKMDHKSQYPAGTNRVYSNFTARSSRMRGIDSVVFFGLQYFIKEYLIKQWNENFFGRSKEEVLRKYKRMMDHTLGKDTISIESLFDLHDLGYLPIEIKALEEGTIVPIKVPMLTVDSKEGFGWLTNYIETILSCILWGPVTSATTAKLYKDILDMYCDITGGDKSFIQWQGHDFSMRGMFGLEAACLSGAGHLLSFTGTDTIPAIEFLENYYGANIENNLIGSSVPATEHSVMCAGGRDSEFETYKRLITEVYPEGIVSIVSDTWHFWDVITNHLVSLKDDIMKRNGKLVIRPDSGDPVNIICGLIKVDHPSEIIDNVAPENWSNYFFVENGKHFQMIMNTEKNKEIAEIDERVCKGAVELLWDIFGGIENEKGYKVLDPHIGIIYGDSITVDRCNNILARLAYKKFVSTTPVFGIGSYTYQHVTRDTFGMAMKSTYCEVNGEPREIFKDPFTDNGTKRSAKGLLAVYKDEGTGKLVLQDQVTQEQVDNCELKTVFLNSKLIRETTLDEIRERLNKKAPQVEVPKSTTQETV